MASSAGAPVRKACNLATGMLLCVGVAIGTMACVIATAMHIAPQQAILGAWSSSVSLAGAQCDVAAI